MMVFLELGICVTRHCASITCVPYPVQFMFSLPGSDNSRNSQRGNPEPLVVPPVTGQEKTIAPSSPVKKDSLVAPAINNSGEISDAMASGNVSFQWLKSKLPPGGFAGSSARTGMNAIQSVAKQSNVHARVRRI